MENFLCGISLDDAITKMEYLFILASLFFITAGQLLQKLSADKAIVIPTHKGFFQQILSQFETWLAVISLVIGTLLWLVVLYKMDVSKAFPFLSLGLVFVLLVSRFYLRETIRPLRWLGVGFIGIGIVIMSQT